MKQIEINSNDAGRRLDKFMRRYLAKATLSTIYKVIRKDVKVNGKREGNSYMLAAGDMLTLYMSDAQIAEWTASSETGAGSKVRRSFKIVYEDRYLIVVDKSVGVLSMAAGHSSLNVKAILDTYFENSGQKCRAHVVHRLDRETSGLMVYVKDMETEQILEHNWHDMVYDRRYVAVVSGEIVDEGGTISSWLKDNSSYITYSSTVDNGGKYAVTHFHVLKRTTTHSLVEYKLETGRKNQIRVHSADIGHPVCGDLKYGNGDNPIGRLCLHAYMLCFYHPATRERMEFNTPIPQTFKQLFK